MSKSNEKVFVQQLWVAAERARSVVVLAEDDEEPEMADTKALRVVLATKGSVAKQMRERARQKQAQNQVTPSLAAWNPKELFCCIPTGCRVDALTLRKHLHSFLPLGSFLFQFRPWIPKSWTFRPPHRLMKLLI
jgi:hypothetical protein